MLVSFYQMTLKSTLKFHFIERKSPKCFHKSATVLHETINMSTTSGLSNQIHGIISQISMQPNVIIVFMSRSRGRTGGLDPPL